jgi:hypothetical protein
LSQALVLRRHTTRWSWWTLANFASWLLVDLLFLLLAQRFSAFDFTQTDGPGAEVYLMLIATTPLTGRALLWVLAPATLTDAEPVPPVR